MNKNESNLDWLNSSISGQTSRDDNASEVFYV